MKVIADFGLPLVIYFLLPLSLVDLVRHRLSFQSLFIHVDLAVQETLSISLCWSPHLRHIPLPHFPLTITAISL